MESQNSLNQEPTSPKRIGLKSRYSTTYLTGGYTVAIYGIYAISGYKLYGFQTGGGYGFDAE